jgi:hypothetical protein
MEISTFLISKFKDQKSLDLHEKSLDLSNYEIFPHKILKSRTFKKSSILIVNSIGQNADIYSSKRLWKPSMTASMTKSFSRPILSP